MPLPTPVSYPHIETPHDGPPRLKRLPRIRVAQIIMDHLAHAWDATEICRQYPHLRPAEVHAAFAFYFDNRELIDAEIDAEWRAAKELVATPHTSPFFLRMRREGRL